MALEANNLYFRYDDKQPWILENKSLKIKKGDRIVF